MVHIGKPSLKLPIILIEHCRCLQVRLCASNCSSSHVNFSLDLDALLIPKVQKLFFALFHNLILTSKRPQLIISPHSELFLCIVQKVKYYHIVLIEEVKTSLLKLYIAFTHEPWNLQLIKEFIQDLETSYFLFVEEANDVLK